ncbi:MAG: acyl-CoA synthetase [Pseudomonadales bacterium]|nr:acyl-CoA synthetase [Pseudomonadales bacterium]
MTELSNTELVAQPTDSERTMLWSASGAVSERVLLERAARLAAHLPARRHIINLCEEREPFLLAFIAALMRSQTTLLPATRAVQAIADVEALHDDSYRCDDARVRAALAGLSGSTTVAAGFSLTAIDPHFSAAIGFTSGSTGAPQAHRKRWRMFVNSARANAAAMRAACSTLRPGRSPTIVATVPSQHMYGMELAVMLPLLAGMAIYHAKPLFAAEIGAALAAVPEPRVLVSTPIHLRVLLESDLPLPSLALIVSATAPLADKLAEQLEQRLGAPLLEMFGATETMVIAARQTARERAWRLYPNVTLTPTADLTEVDAPWLEHPQHLQDLIDLQDDGCFTLRGRSADSIEIGGKRGSLSELTHRLLAIEGVEDAVVVQPGDERTQIRRVAALIVAPSLTRQAILTALARSIDPVFLPRPLYLVEQLPRNAVGKLPRAAVLDALQAAARTQR